MFSIRLMRGSDVIMYLEEENNSTICCTSLVFDRYSKVDTNDPNSTPRKFNSEDFREQVGINQLVKKHSIFRTQLIDFCGMRFWKTLPLNDETLKLARQRITIIDTPIKTEEELVKHTERVASLPLGQDELQWSIELCANYLDDRAVMIGRIHHGLTDGMGTMMMLASIDGDKNLPAIPQMKDLSTLKKTVLFLMAPLLFAYSFYLNLDTTLSGCFKDKKSDSSTKESNPFKLTKGYSGKKSLAVSKLYNFEELKSCYKSYKDIKFNDFFMGCIGTAFKKYATKLGCPGLKSVGVGIPVSLRPPPTTLEKGIVLQNSLGLGMIKFPIHEDLSVCIYEGKKELSEKISLLVMWGSQKIQLLLKYFPDVWNRKLVTFLSGSGQVAVSNVPGLKEEITIGGYPMKDTFFLTPNCFSMGMCILGITYRGTFKFSVFADESLEAKSQETLDFICREMDSEISKL